MVAGPGAAARLLPGTKGLKRVHLAGETLSGIDKAGRAIALPAGGGGTTTLGPPTNVFVDATGDASGFAWIANGCARVAAIPVSTAPTRPGDPCPSTEIAYAYIASTRLRGRTITVPVGCTAAPRGVCRGTAIARIFEGDGKAAAAGRFAIPVGKSRDGEDARDPSGARGVPPRGLREPRHGCAHPERAHRRGRGRQCGTGGRDAGR